MLAYVAGAFVPIFTFNQTQAPEFYVGLTYTACLGDLGFVLTIVTQWLLWRDDKREKLRLSEQSAASDVESQVQDVTN